MISNKKRIRRILKGIERPVSNQRSELRQSSKNPKRNWKVYSGGGASTQDTGRILKGIESS